MTPVPDPDPVPAQALSVARLLSNSATIVKAVRRGIRQGTGTGSTDPHLNNPAAATDLDTATTVSSRTPPSGYNPSRGHASSISSRGISGTGANRFESDRGRNNPGYRGGLSDRGLPRGRYWPRW